MNMTQELTMNVGMFTRFEKNHIINAVQFHLKYSGIEMKSILNWNFYQSSDWNF